MIRAIRILAVVAGLATPFAIGSPSEAREARGAFIYSTNHPDPTVAPHRHRMKTRTIRLTDSQIELSKCRSCGLVLETETSSDGRTPPVLRRYYPVP
jgi:hypothetical protein